MFYTWKLSGEVPRTIELALISVTDFNPKNESHLESTNFFKIMDFSVFCWVEGVLDGGIAYKLITDIEITSLKSYSNLI